MPQAVFSLKVGFAAGNFNIERHANDLSHFGGCRTRRICSFSKCSLNSFAIPILSLRSIGIPEMLQAPLAKTSIRSKIRLAASSVTV
jgi:hypothetical protein